jgi:hypothetical protein
MGHNLEGFNISGLSIILSLSILLPKILTSFLIKNIKRLSLLMISEVERGLLDNNVSFLVIMYLQHIKRAMIDWHSLKNPSQQIHTVMSAQFS